jgi:hypothetical protein
MHALKDRTDMKALKTSTKSIKGCGGKRCGSNWAGATTGTALNDLKKAA